MILLLKRNIWKENPYLIENRLNRINMWDAIDNHNYICYICAKQVLNSNVD